MSDAEAAAAQEALPGLPAAGEPDVQEAMFVPPAEGDDSFKAVPLIPRYTPAKRPLESFYIPLLSRAKAYDRAVGYWSATELVFAAQGVAHFIARGAAMRLMVGAQLHQADVNAVLSGKPLEDVLAERMLADPDLEGTKIIQNEHLAVLAWMVKHDRLQIRVGVPTDGKRLLTYAESGRYFHTKYGIFTDFYGNKVAFDGSNNATVSGWIKNHETFDVYPSWKQQVWEWNGQAAVDDFARNWEDHPDEGWAIVPLPTAVREHLVTYAPASPPLPKPHETGTAGNAGRRGDRAGVGRTCCPRAGAAPRRLHGGRHRSGRAVPAPGPADPPRGGVVSARLRVRRRGRPR